MPLLKKIDTFEVEPFLKIISDLESEIQWTESTHAKQAGIQYKEGENIWSSAVGKLKKQESDYHLINPIFKNTVIEDIIKEYKMFRTRLMWVNPFSCYSFHNDSSPRIHFPIITNPDCLFVFRNGIMEHFSAGEVWWVDTRFKHTFLNTSKYPRLHILGVVDS